VLQKQDDVMSDGDSRNGILKEKISPYGNHVRKNPQNEIVGSLNKPYFLFFFPLFFTPRENDCLFNPRVSLFGCVWVVEGNYFFTVML